MDTLFWGLVALLVGIVIGWRAAHITLAEECTRVGKFFLGKTVYECTAIKNTDPKKVD